MGNEQKPEGGSVGCIRLLDERIRELEQQHGSLRAAARVLQVDPAYLWRLKVGEKDDPSDRLLRKLGLRRTVIYERT